MLVASMTLFAAGGGGLSEWLKDPKWLALVAFLVVVGLVMLLVFFSFFRLWLQSKLTNARIGILDLVGSVGSPALIGLCVLLAFGESAIGLDLIVPGEVGMVVSGAAAERNGTALVFIVVAGSLGAVAGDSVGFALGLLRGGPPGAFAAWAAFTLPSAIVLILFAFGAAALGGPVGTGILTGLKIVAVAIVGRRVPVTMRPSESVAADQW